MKTEQKLNLTKHYNELYESSLRKIEGDNYQIDAMIDSTSDSRFGLTLLARPSAEVKSRIQSFLKKLKAIDPHQYYYPSSDIHITILSIISCYQDFDINKITLPNYIKVIKESIGQLGKFTICCQGITASDSGIMVQGFPQDDTLDVLRNNLRAYFRNSGLQQSIDSRYTLQTAHSTVVRFRRHLQNKNAFLEEVQTHRYKGFGCFEVKGLELVHNDWYHRKQNTSILKKFTL